MNYMRVTIISLIDSVKDYVFYFFRGDAQLIAKTHTCIINATGVLLFVAESVDRIEAGRFPGRVEAEAHADER
jgi:hypothetical protein